MTSDGCADPDGFDTCWAAATDEATSLFAKYCTTGQCTDENDCYSPDPNCAETVSCIAYTAWINCALSTCWNRVYGCEYQNLAINAVQNCPLATSLAPYVPAPHAAPGYCSCNMGFVFEAFLNEGRYGAGEPYRCQNSVPVGKEGTTCKCCGSSSAVSSFYNACPSTDPDAVPIFPILGLQALTSPTCVSALDGIDCSALPYNFTISPGPTFDPNAQNQFFDASDLPQNGTQPLSDNPGGPSTPVSGAVITWSLYKGAETVASASVTTWNDGPPTAVVSTSGGSSVTVTPTSGGTNPTTTGSATAASTATTKGNAGLQLNSLSAVPSLFMIVWWTLYNF